MDDGCRVQRRLHRTKPYDLRRKVLLKNFLREQMTHTPHINEAEINNMSNANTNENAASTTVNEDQNNSKVNKCESSSDCINSETEDSDAIVEGDLNIKLTEQNKEKGNNLFNNFSLPKSQHFTSLMSLSNHTKKFRNKGVFKAKYLCKNSILKEKKQKNLATSVFSSINENKEKHFKENTYKNPKKTIMHKIFKSARQNRKNNQNILDNTKLNNNCNTSSQKLNHICNNTSSQSVQTDLSMSFRELDNVKKDNILLREENKYLYERLASFTSEAPSSSLNRDDSTTTFAANSNNSLDGLHEIWHTYVKGTSTEPKINTLSEKKEVKEVVNSKALDAKLVDLDFRPKSPKLCLFSGTLSHLSLQNNNLKHYEISLSSPLKESRLGINCQNKKMKAKPTCLFPSIKKSKTSTPLNKYSTRKVKRNSSMPEKCISKKINFRSCRRSESVRNNTVPFNDLPVDAFY